jgi:predicted phosphodiesterase
MKAIISDIHSNLEALQAVLADIERHKVESICCLGDVVGYGPNPRECVDLAMEWELCLLGNHDQAALHNPKHYPPSVKRANRWTSAQLQKPIPTPEDADRRLAFLDNLPRTWQGDDLVFVHGSPRNPVNEYIFPEDIYNPPKLDSVFDMIERYCFVGHTHLPGIFTQDHEFHTPEEIDGVYRLDRRKTLCNVGSVGQPRDADWRACYVLVDGDTVRFRRIEYDVDTTVRKIRSISDLDNFLGD